MYLTDEYKQKVLDKPWGNSFIIINLIHCLFPIYAFLYPVFFRSKLGDHIYLGVILTITIQWVILKNECIINYIEKKRIDPNYKLGDNDYDPGFMYIRLCLGIDSNKKNKKKQVINEIIRLAITNLSVLILFIYVSYRSIENKKIRRLLIVILIICLLITYIISYYFKRKNYICNLKHPKWVKSDAVKNAINKKACSKVSLKDIYHDIDINFLKTYIILPSWEKWESDMNKILPILQKENPDYIVGILTGGGIIAEYLSYKTGIPYINVKASKYSEKSYMTNVIEFINNTSSVLLKPEPRLKNIKNKKVVLIDDIIDTGHTMKTIYDVLSKYQPKKIVTITAARQINNKVQIKLDYCANLEEQNVLPYGFDA